MMKLVLFANVAITLITLCIGSGHVHKDPASLTLPSRAEKSTLAINDAQQKVDAAIASLFAAKDDLEKAVRATNAPEPEAPKPLPIKLDTCKEYDDVTIVPEDPAVDAYGLYKCRPDGIYWNLRSVETPVKSTVIECNRRGTKPVANMEYYHITNTSGYYVCFPLKPTFVWIPK